MGTYAEWILWVGITEDSFSLRSLPTSAQTFLENVQSSITPMKKKGLLIETIYMHGESVGIGVVIHRTNWEVEIGEDNIFNPDWVTEAIDTQVKLNRLLAILKIPVQASIFQHIDLGG